MKFPICQLLLVSCLATFPPAALFSQENNIIRNELKIQDGEIVNAEDTLRFTQGDTLIINWSSNQALELHLHGYDITQQINPNDSNEMNFIATIPGRFPITIHGSEDNHAHRTLLYIEIYPK